jgi:hypothetical protein
MAPSASPAAVQEMVFEQQLVPQAIRSDLRIGIFYSATREFAEQYSMNVDGLECYAQRHGYQLFFEPEHHIWNRHLSMLSRLKQVDWMLFMDLDALIVNLDHRIEEFVDDDVDLICSQRFLNGEMAAGAYLIRNSPWSAAFVTEWVGRQRFDPSDNWAFMRLLHRRLFTAPHQLDPQLAARGTVCDGMYAQPVKFRRAKCCTMVLTRGKRKFVAERIKFLRRGQGYFRDDFVREYLLPSDVFVHSKRRWDAAVSDFSFKHPNGTCRDLHGLIWPQFLIRGGFMRRMLCERDMFFSSEPWENAYPDVYDCFPHCSDEQMEPSKAVLVDEKKQCRNSGPVNTFRNATGRCDHLPWVGSADDQRQLDAFVQRQSYAPPLKPTQREVDGW